jgi:hypothetical protein
VQGAGTAGVAGRWGQREFGILIVGHV